MHHAARLLAVTLLATLPAAADYETGLAAYSQGDFATALAEWEPLAEAGHAESRFYMGVLYGSGEGVPRDLRRSAEYYRLAAEQGHGLAQNALAFVFRVGNGVPQSYAEAFKWYRLAAENGISEAQFNLGSLYAGGKGTQRDFIEGYKWFSIAAAFDVEEAREALFYCADQMSAEQIAEAQRRAAAWRPKD